MLVALPAMKCDLVRVVISISALYCPGRVWTCSFAALLVATVIVYVIYIVKYFIGRDNVVNRNA